MLRILALMTLLLAATWVTASPIPIVVDCGAGQLLNRTLAKLDKYTPATVQVKGTCTEYVLIHGFDGLTLKGVQGAALVPPAGDPGNGGLGLVLIEASRSITIDGFTIHSGSSTVDSIGVRGNSLDVRLRNLKIDGGANGITAFEASQVSIARVTVRDHLGYAAVAVWDVSDVHVEDCLFERSTGAMWHVGIAVGSGHVTMHGTKIRNMQQGISIGGSGSVDIVDYYSYYPPGGPTDVVIENPAGTNFSGVWVGNGSSLNIGRAKLRITNPGQSWGWNTAGVTVDGGTLNAGGNLVVSGSQGHGVFLSNNSYASLAGSSITGSGHGGLVAVNMSTIAVGTSNPLTEISGNGMDLFCDSKSLITGGANVANAATVQCSNLLPGDYENLP